MHRTQDMIAATLAISGFTAAVVAGMAASNAPLGVVARALFAMILCWIVGQFLGKTANVAIDEHIRMFTSSRPVPAMIDADDDVIDVDPELSVDNS